MSLPPLQRRLAGAAILGLLALTSPATTAHAVDRTFTSPGSETVTVPPGVTGMSIVLHGAGGGGSDCFMNTAFCLGGGGGAGGRVEAAFALTQGTTFTVTVGGAPAQASPWLAGFNGGGSGVAPYEGFFEGSYGSWQSGGGGGASDVRMGGTGLDDRVAIAAGGGGAGAGIGGSSPAGGAGGGAVGGDGTPSGGASVFGRGGSQSAGGAPNGTLGVGGGGAQTPAEEGGGAGGGGGGGRYGGGGASVFENESGGGGGGSSLVPSGGTTTAGGGSAAGADGRVEITWTIPTPTLLASNPASPSQDETPRISGTASAGSTVQLFANASCEGTPVVTGTAADFADPGFQVTVPENTTSLFSAQAVGGDATSACSDPLTYEEDSAVAPVSSFSIDGGTTSSSNDVLLRMDGIEPESTVSVYAAPTTADCTGDPVATVPNAREEDEVSFSVADDTTTTFRATVQDRAGNVSDCSSASITYVEDSTPPVVSDLATDPASPSGELTPRVSGTVSADVGEVSVYRRGDCLLAGGETTAYGPFTREQLAAGVPVPARAGETTTFGVVARDAAGNASECTTIAYEHRATAPGAPAITEVSPGSGSPAGSVRVRGDAAGASTVRLHLAAECRGPVAVTGSRAAFEGEGLLVDVPVGTSTFSARAADAGGVTSGCSAQRSHVRDVEAPVVSITAPADGARSTDATPEFAGLAGTAERDEAAVTVTIRDAGGAVAATLDATRGAGGAWSVRPTQPLAPGTYAAQAAQRDAGGNVGRSATVTFTVVERPADTTVTTPPAGPTGTTPPAGAGATTSARPVLPSAGTLRITSVRAARDGTVTVRYAATGPGVLALRLTVRGLRRAYLPRRVTVRRAGRGRVVLRPRAAARARLVRRRSARDRRVVVRGTFRPVTGPPVEVRATVTLPARR